MKENKTFSEEQDNKRTEYYSFYGTFSLLSPGVDWFLEPKEGSFMHWTNFWENKLEIFFFFLNARLVLLLIAKKTKHISSYIYSSNEQKAFFYNNKHSSISCGYLTWQNLRHLKQWIRGVKIHVNLIKN